MGDLSLFPDLPTAPPVPSLTKARALLARVEDLESVMDDFPAECRAVARYAKNLGAHSVARACRWISCYEAFERHGYDAIHARAERIAEKWVERLERGRLS